MNISRKVLGARWLKRTYSVGVVCTWTDEDGWVFFGLRDSTTAYLYISPYEVLAYYDTPDRAWRYINPVATHPWRTEL